MSEDLAAPPAQPSMPPPREDGSFRNTVYWILLGAGLIVAGVLLGAGISWTSVAFRAPTEAPAAQVSTQNATVLSSSVGDVETDIQDRVPRAQANTSLSPAGRFPVTVAVSDRNLEIYIFSAGQADSMLIRGPGPEHRSMLVDLGEPVDGSAPRPRNARDLSPRIHELLGGTNRVDYFMLSHFHTDHGGLPGAGVCGRSERSSATGIFALLDQVYGQFSVGTFFDPGDSDEAYISDETLTHCGVIERIPQWIRNKIVQKRITPGIGTKDINLGNGVTLEIVVVSGRVSPGAESLMDSIAKRPTSPYATNQPASENDRSIAFILKYGEFEFFSGGDLTGTTAGHENEEYEIQRYRGGKSAVYTNVESHLVKEWNRAGKRPNIAVYRVNHHGSEHSTNNDLALALHPQVVIYSSGRGNSYGHPNPEVANRLCNRGSHAYITHGISEEAWRGGFPADCGEVVGDEIEITVPAGGLTYSVNGDRYTSP